MANTRMTTCRVNRSPVATNTFSASHAVRPRSRTPAMSGNSISMARHHPWLPASPALRAATTHPFVDDRDQRAIGCPRPLPRDNLQRAAGTHDLPIGPTRQDHGGQSRPGDRPARDRHYATMCARRGAQVQDGTHIDEGGEHVDRVGHEGEPLRRWAAALHRDRSRHCAHHDPGDDHRGDTNFSAYGRRRSRVSTVRWSA
jgi:hypothetical protein